MCLWCGGVSGCFCVFGGGQGGGGGGSLSISLIAPLLKALCADAGWIVGYHGAAQQSRGLCMWRLCYLTVIPLKFTARSHEQERMWSWTLKIRRPVFAKQTPSSGKALVWRRRKKECAVLSATKKVSSCKMISEDEDTSGRNRYPKRDSQVLIGVQLLLRL